MFIAKHPAEAYFVKGLLETEGIQAEVQGEALFTLRGDAPAMPDTLPSVWVPDDSPVDAALAIVSAYQSGEGPGDAGNRPWRCRSCGEQLEPQFTECWNCGGGQPRAE